MLGTMYNTRNFVQRDNPKEIHLVMPFTGERFSISGFTMTDTDKLSPQDKVFLSQLGFPSYSTGSVAELQEHRPLVYDSRILHPTTTLSPNQGDSRRP